MRSRFVDLSFVDRSLYAVERFFESCEQRRRGRETQTGRWGYLRNGTYRPVRRNAGFFSQLSTTLDDLQSLRAPIRKVVARSAFEQYRTLPGTDSWSRFFARPANKSLTEERVREHELHLIDSSLHHADYSLLNLNAYQILLEIFFQPSPRVLEREAHFISSYAIDAAEIIAVNVRGTDKWKEIEPSPIGRYLSIAEKALENHPSSKLLVVTDQAQFLDAFRNRFPRKVVSIDELPVSSQFKSPIHRTLKRSNREAFAIDFLAAVRIMASAKLVLTHTGNVAFWTVLFRGSSSGVVQLRADEVLGSFD